MGSPIPVSWTGSDYPISEWATEILEEGLHQSVIYPLTIQKRNNKKTYFMQTSHATGT